VEFATLEWVDGFNNRRLLEPIGNIPPVEFEQAYYWQQDAPAMVARVNQFGLREDRRDPGAAFHRFTPAPIQETLWIVPSPTVEVFLRRGE
jgi:hypothetical protein